MTRLNPRHLYASLGSTCVLALCGLLFREPEAKATAQADSLVVTPKEPTNRSKVAKTQTKGTGAQRKVEEHLAPLPEQFYAFDVSRPFGRERGSFDRLTWTEFCRASLRSGRRMVVVQARGSASSNPYADLLLKGAREEGLRTAAYVFVNFKHSAPTGDNQVLRAIKAVGSEAKHLDFFVVDVESGSAGSMTQAERVNRIGQAVEAVTKAGLRPVIYAKNTGGRRGEWTDLTGNATDFSYLPLWVPRYDLMADLAIDGDYTRAWEPFGGWGARHGKQFADDRLTIGPVGLPVDDNIFARDILDGPKSSRPYRVCGLLRVVRGKAKRDKKTGQVVQAVRIVNQSRSPILGPLSVILRGLTGQSPLVNGSGEARLTGSPYVKVPSQSLEPGDSVRMELRFAETTTAPPDYDPEVRAGDGEV